MNIIVRVIGGIAFNKFDNIVGRGLFGEEGWVMYMCDIYYIL